MITPMGAALDIRPILTDAERCAAVRDALATGVVTRLRELHGWTIGQLAAALGEPPEEVHRWESGHSEPPPPVAALLWGLLIAACRAP